MTVQPRELLELDIDTRLADEWRILWEDFPEIANEVHMREAIAVFMRAAYGRGYVDALKDKGKLMDLHGYARPAA